MADRNTFDFILAEIAVAFRPLLAAFATSDDLRDFLDELGWEFDSSPAGLSVVQPAAQALDAVIDGGEINAQHIPVLLGLVEDLLVAIRGLSQDTSLGQEFRNAFPSELLDFLLVGHLLYARRRLGKVLELVGLIGVEAVEATSTRPEHSRYFHRFSEFDSLLSDPLFFITQVYRWGDSDFKGEELLGRISALIRTTRFPVWDRSLSHQQYAALADVALNDEEVVPQSLHVSLWKTDVAPALEIGAGLFVLPESASAKPGLALIPYSSFGSELGLQIGTARISLNGVAAGPGSIAALQRPNQPTAFVSGLDVGQIAPLAGGLSVGFEASFDPNQSLVLGFPEGVRIELLGFGIEFGVRAGSGEAADAYFELTATGSFILPADENSDRFSMDLTGGYSVATPLRLGIGFSGKRGLYLCGASSWSVNSSSAVSIGPLRVESTEISIKSSGGNAIATAVVSFSGRIGPVVAIVEDSGVGFSVSFPEEHNGNLGALDASLAFLPPTGAGIAINTGPVTGGGFLTFGADRYTGALQLKVNQIAMSAFGVIDTKLPEGQDGFSFVILISAEFQPIQLGLGFTLNGVGGLAGLNRTVDVKALQDVVRRGTMDKLLFPKKPAEDAAEIISTLSDVFPPAKDRHVFGPMAKIGWGSPTLIEGRLGLLLEVPEPQRLTLLGTISAELPKKKQGALVKLNMDVLGVLDFGDKSLAIDAQLRDSNAGGFPISGDMAMRLRWGDRPNFALSVGGLNPNYESPAGFPELARVRIDLGKGDNPSIGVDAYLAITSNTAQIGARAELNASGAGIKLHGWLGFDALFIFAPFQFVAEIEAGVRVSFHGVGKTIRLHGQLSGPGPYRIKGKVCVSVAFWDACLSFDKSFGESRRISAPEVDPWVGNDDFPGLGTALADLRNWQAEPPPGTAQVVSLRTRTRNAPPAPGQTGDEIGVDPLGTATFRQRVVPLNQEITRFGAVPLKEPRLYKVASVTMPNANASAGAAVQEFFAPAQYRTMKDAERISAPSFEPMDAGFKLAGADHAEGPRKTKDVTYKTSFIGTSGTTTYTLPGEELPKLTKRGAAVRAGIDATDLRRFVDRTVPRKVTIANTGWVIGLRKTLQRVPTSEVATNYSTAAAALANLIAGSDLNRQQYAIFPAHEIDASEAP